MNASERLNAARAAARDGLFAEALSEYIWFHEHALEEQPSLVGVRLSFALGYWIELAGEYPPARAALQGIRDRKTKLLEDGVEDWELFKDVTAINRELCNDEATYNLFWLINSKNPVFAARCARLATPALVKAHAFKFAKSFIPDPEQEIERLASRFNQGIERANRKSPVERRIAITDAEVRIYSEDVAQLVTIFFMSGEEKRGDALMEYAIELADGSEMRDAIRAAVDERLSSGQLG